MTPAERGIALAAEGVPGVAKTHALSAGATGSEQDRFSFLVELRPYRGTAIAEVHYAIMRVLGRQAAARVTYGDADAPSPTLLRRATELTLTQRERQVALDEAATRVLPVEEQPPAPTSQPYPLTLLIVDVDPETLRAVRRAAGPTDAITDSGFGMPLRGLVDVAVHKQYDVIFTTAPTTRRVSRAVLAGWEFFLQVTARDPRLGSLFVFANLPGDVLTEPARRMNLRRLTKPLDATSVRDVLDSARRRYAHTGQDVETVGPSPVADVTLSDCRHDVTALRAKGGAACEQLADLMEKAVANPEAYAAALREKAEKDGPASARAIPTGTKEILDLLHATAKALLSMP